LSVIFWDFDGTLAHSTHLWSNSVYKALLSVDPNTDMTFEQVRICNRSGFTWQTPEEDYTAFTGDAWWELMNEHFYNSYRAYGVTESVALTAASRVRDVIKRIENYQLYPDTLHVLKTTKNGGHSNVLLSNNYPDLQPILDHLGLSPLLDGVILSALEGYDKPRRELFDIAKSRFPSDHYYMVGDNESADIDGGNAAGMTTIFVHNGHSSRASYSFSDLSDCLTIFDS